MLRLLCSLCVVVGLTACSKGPADFGQFVITWEITDGTDAIPCGEELVDAATVELEIEAPSISRLSLQAPCAQESLATRVVPLDDYTVTVRLIDGAGLVTATEVVDVALSEPEEVLDLPVEIRVEEGRFEVEWTVNLDGNTACPDGSITEIEALNLVTAEAAVTRFDCERFRGLTGLLPFGDYVLRVRLADRAGAVIAESGAASSSLAFQTRLVPLSVELVSTP